MTFLAVLRALWGFLRSPLGQVLALAVGLAALLSWADARAYRRGVSHERGVWVERGIKQAAEARKVEAKNERAGQKVGQAVAVETTKIEWRTRTLIERIPYAVPASAADWRLPVGVLRLHVAATTGVPDVADPAGRADGEPSDVGLSELATVDIENAGRCLAWRAQLIGWQTWARDVGLAAPSAR